MEKSKKIQFERPSEEIEEMIGIVPNWIIRWGISVALFLLLCLLTLANFIKYPDIITAAFEIKAREQPYEISWGDSKNVLYTLKVEEKQMVNKGDIVLEEANLDSRENKSYRAPFSGTALIFNINRNNRNENILWVFPKITSYEVIVKLPSYKSGKIQPGQRIMLHLNEYPKSEFGYLEGIVISRVPIKIDDFYLAHALLKRGLTTDLGISIPDQASFTGEAKIVTDEKSVLQRIFSLLSN